MEEVNKEIFKIENLNLYYSEKHAKEKAGQRSFVRLKNRQEMI